MPTNSTDQESQFDLLRGQIESSLEKAQAQRKTLKRSNTRYTTANVILSAIAALLTGTAGTVGNAENWKVTCLLAAVVSSCAAVTAKLQTSEQLVEASECVGQLKALRVETIAQTADLGKVSERYQQILSEFSAIDC